MQATADSMEIAFDMALGQVPNISDVRKKKEVVVPERRVIIVEAFDEQVAASNARLQATSQLGNTAIVKSIKLVTAGKKGFLGIGRKHNQYEAEILRQAVIEVAYKTKVKLSVKLLDAEALEEQQRIEEEERLAEEAAERRRHWEALEDDEARLHSHFN